MTNYGFMPAIGPEVHVGVNKSRQKVYNAEGLDTIFMYDNQEFQLEFFNPTQQSVLAKIYMNGSLISNRGLIVRPGERVWLDRNLDDPNRFKFNTYTIENTPESKAATVNNGMIRVDFYYEDTTPAYIQPIWTPYTYTVYPTVYYHSNIIGTSGLSGSMGTAGTRCSNTVTSSNIGSTDTTFNGEFKCSSNTSFDSSKNFDFMETGRIEKGSVSDQRFNTVNMNFNSWVSKTVMFKLVPYSQKQTVTVDEIKIKCKNCGKKAKKGDIYCRKCGTKL